MMDYIDFSKTSIDVYYQTKEGFLPGSFDNIPENAFRAHIIESFIFIGANGELKQNIISFDLFVGQLFDVNILLNYAKNHIKELQGLPELRTQEILRTILYRDTFQCHLRAGIKTLVLTDVGSFPVRDVDAAFSTQEEMTEAISKINERFKSVYNPVQNTEIQAIHK